MTPTLRRLFNLRRDQDDPDVIDAEIRAGSRPVGANLWVLFFAILIASVGLNVNSTAVIIGAMLVSPLMGPIQAMGYGAGVQDVKLIRQGALALAIFTLLSLVSSTLYFAVSPLNQPGSELLARTSPTLWDVLIALFGGAAGMVAATRKDVSNVVPGVAIATALMPPLCTVGFGLANARWDMVGGAFYLFVINGVFIAVGTLAISKLLRLPLRGSVEPAVRARHRLLITVGITAVLVPSVWFGYRVVQNELFLAGASRVAVALQEDARVVILSQQADPHSRTLRLTVVGTVDESRLQELAQALFRREGLAGVQLELRRAGDAPLDVGSLRAQLKQDIDRTVLQRLRAVEVRLQSTDQLVAGLAAPQVQARAVDVATLRDEVRAQLPQVTALTLAWGQRSAAADLPLAVATSASAPAQTALVVVERTQALSVQQSAMLRRFLAVRLGTPDLQLIEQPSRPRTERPQGASR
jgi:uncharacterized hydrophobic protein (TIGR00271 family)